MPDYKEMYLRMLRASEKALDILIFAQRECEELYLAAPAPEVRLSSPINEDNEALETKPRAISRNAVDGEPLGQIK